MHENLGDKKRGQQNANPETAKLTLSPAARIKEMKENLVKLGGKKALLALIAYEKHRRSS